MRQYRLKPLSTLAAALVFLTWSPTPAAAGGETWALLSLSGADSLDPGVAGTFTDLLANELTSATGMAVLRPEGSCRDAACARAAAEAAGADVACFGTIHVLGKKIIVSVTALMVRSGVVRGSPRMAADRVEDLDAVATRLARALFIGGTAEETAELGAITAHEVPPDRRREGRSGLALGLGVVTHSVGRPTGGDPGAALHVSYWYEARSFAIEPRVSILGPAFDIGTDEGGAWLSIPADVGAYWLTSPGDFSPYVGGGAGVTWYMEERVEKKSVGTIVRAEHEAEVSDGGLGFHVFARGGILLFRTYTMRVSLDASYGITFVGLDNRSSLQAFEGGIRVFF